LEIDPGKVKIRPIQSRSGKTFFADAIILSPKSDFEVMGLISDINTEEI
jgi:hypothetical protein